MCSSSSTLGCSTLRSFTLLGECSASASSLYPHYPITVHALHSIPQTHSHVSTSHALALCCIPLHTSTPTHPLPTPYPAAAFIPYSHFSRIHFPRPSLQLHCPPFHVIHFTVPTPQPSAAIQYPFHNSLPRIHFPRPRFHLHSIPHSIPHTHSHAPTPTYPLPTP